MRHDPSKNNPWRARTNRLVVASVVLLAVMVAGLGLGSRWLLVTAAVGLVLGTVALWVSAAAERWGYRVPAGRRLEMTAADLAVLPPQPEQPERRERRERPVLARTGGGR